MDINKIKGKLKTSEYDFLKNDPRLGENICLLTLGGSLAYGTNLEGHGDIDIRGITLESPDDIIGFGNFEQVVETNTDTVVYGFNKMIKLLCSNNPNTIEILGCKPEHYFHLNEVGQQLLDNKHMFLSQRAAQSFGGYAGAQLNRLENALARDRVDQVQKEEHIRRSLLRAMATFKDRYKDLGGSSVILKIIDSKKENMDKEVCADINLKDYPVREFNSMLNELTNVVGSYDKLSHRNNKKDDEHLNKHAMHLVRLYLMGIDILEKEQINTYRYDDREMLLDIRKGQYMNEDGTYNSSFYDLTAGLQKRFDYACKNTSLPQQPDMNKIEEFVMDINRKIVLEGIEMVQAKNILKNDIEKGR